MILSLSMTSFNQKNATPFSLLSPSPDLLGEANSHHGRRMSKGLGPRVPVSKHGWTGGEKEEEGILMFLPNKGGTTHRREGSSTSTCCLLWGNC